MRIIPAIDLIDGKCVRLEKGDYNKKTQYYEDPLDAAKQFEDSGIAYLHLVDLDGARAGKVVNRAVLEKIASQTQLKIDFSGGIRTEDDVKSVFENGANQITLGSIAVKNPELFSKWLQKYGAEKIILGADTLDGKISVNGWLESAGVELSDFLQNKVEQGVQYVMCTDISKDGMMQGPSFELYEKILKQHSELKLIASGGISSIEDLQKLKSMGIEGVIVGKAIYEGKIMLNQIAYL